MTRHRLDKANNRIDARQLPQLREFDLISGLTGIGVYLLHRHHSGDLLNDLLAYLVRLTGPLAHDSDMLPGWWCGASPIGRGAYLWPGGHGYLGIAHGISGPRAPLSITMRRGICVPGHAEALDRICTWLEQWRTGTGPHTCSPGLISRPEWRDRTIRQPGPQPPADIRELRMDQVDRPNRAAGP